MKIEWIIFDFDGTIADTHRTFINILNGLSGEFGYQPVHEEDIPKLRGLSSHELIQNSEISIFKIPFLLKKAKQELNKEMVNVLPIPQMEESLKELHKKGYKLGILTSNISENVTIFLDKNNLTHLFDFVHSGSTLFGKDKILKKIFQEYKIIPESAVYVGDETRDIDAAQKMGMMIVAVTWGFNSQELLAQHQPTFLISHAEELLSIL